MGHAVRTVPCIGLEVDMGIEQIIVDEAFKRVDAGFGVMSEVIRSGYIAAYRESLMRIERERLWNTHIQRMAEQLH